jgi:hypothetical protein
MSLLRLSLYRQRWKVKISIYKDIEMVSDIPARFFEDESFARRLGLEEKRTYGDIDSLRTSFIDADTADEMGRFLKRHHLHYGINEALGMRHVLVTVVSVQALIDSGTATLDNLAELGITFKELAEGKPIFIFYYELYTIDELLEGEKTDCWYSKQLEHPSDKHMPTMLRNINYAEFAAKDGAVYFILPAKEIYEQNGVTSIEECAPIVAQWFVDSAISAHLRNASVLSKNSQELIACDDFIETVYYSLFDAFRGGRAGRCLVCGKPYISKMERGKPRRYCSDRCSKRAQRGGIASKRTKPSDTPKA